MHKARHKILIIGPSWVGDMIMSQSLFKTLKQLDHKVQIDVLAPQWTRPLLERMPEVSESLNMDLKHGEFGWSKRKSIAMKLREHAYDQCIVIPNSLKSALIPYFAKIPKRTGWLKEPRYLLLNDLRRLDKERYPLMVQRLNALAYEPDTELPALLPEPELLIDQAQVTSALSAHQLNNDKPILILCPGAEFGASKRWPESYYAELADRYLNDGWQVWLFGSANDFDVCHSINLAVAEACNNLAGKTTLAQAIDLMSLANLVISNDSGLMHMAAALKRPQVAIYGSTSTAFTPPLSKHCLVVQHKIDCSPCFERECPLKHHRCMKELTPAMVLQQLKENSPQGLQ